MRPLSWLAETRPVDRGKVALDCFKRSQTAACLGAMVKACRAVDEIMRASPGSSVQFRHIDLESFRFDNSTFIREAAICPVIQ